ncbi:MAG: hypothetical protein QHC79_07500, partial [Pseudosphingobacterium sp.]|nr:hypothetical protein [Pseudosphingobacterium sp.]
QSNINDSLRSSHFVVNRLLFEQAHKRDYLALLGDPREGGFKATSTTHCVRHTLLLIGFCLSKLTKAY